MTTTAATFQKEITFLGGFCKKCNLTPYILNGIKFYVVKQVTPSGKEVGDTYYLTEDGLKCNNFEFFAMKYLNCEPCTDFSAATPFVEMAEVAQVTAPKMDKKSIFKTAWSLVKEAKISFANALKIAWSVAKNATLAKLTTASENNPVKFSFYKEDGEIREAEAIKIFLHTLFQGYIRFQEVIDGNTRMRSFRIERLN